MWLHGRRYIHWQVEHLTGDQRVASLRFFPSGVTVLCSWARHFIHCLALVQLRKTVLTWLNSCWLRCKESKQTKIERLAIACWQTFWNKNCTLLCIKGNSLSVLFYKWTFHLVTLSKNNLPGVTPVPQNFIKHLHSLSLWLLADEEILNFICFLISLIIFLISHAIGQVFTKLLRNFFMCCCNDFEI